ncbi:hypothetical protein [Rudaea sp.]|uniref:LGFP repeat-containing protein n=1 Tax=Rudaea sp. TaxID=2136325 RepID=UPI002ED2CE24
MKPLNFFFLGMLSFALCASTHAAEPYGKIGEKYAALGGHGGALGLPIGDETNAPFGGRFHDFKMGSIDWHPQIGQAYEVYGAIGGKFHELGNAQFGYPITDESTTPDRRGRYNHFRSVQLPGKPESSIYWTPETGAHEIHGLIRDAWAKSGWERGELGYPTSDEFQDGAFRRSNFEHGYIQWSQNTGTRIVKAGVAHDAPRDIHLRSALSTDGWAPISGWVDIVMKPNGDYVFSGHVHNAGAVNIRYSLAAAVVTPSGQSFGFGINGHRVDGTETVFGRHRDHNWNQANNDPRIAANWNSVAEGTLSWRLVASATITSGIENFIDSTAREAFQKLNRSANASLGGQIAKFYMNLLSTL